MGKQLAKKSGVPSEKEWGKQWGTHWGHELERSWGKAWGTE